MVDTLTRNDSIDEIQNNDITLFSPCLEDYHDWTKKHERKINNIFEERPLHDDKRQAMAGEVGKAPDFSHQKLSKEQHINRPKLLNDSMTEKCVAESRFMSADSNKMAAEIINDDQTLDFSHKKLSEDQRMDCFKKLADPKKRRLDVADTGFTSADLNKIAEDDRSEIRLDGKSINLSCNCIGEGMKPLGKILSNGTPQKLNSLELCRCRLNGEKVDILQQNIAPKTRIDEVDLSDNNFDDEGSGAKIVKLAASVQAAKLAVRNCELTDVKEFLEEECRLTTVNVTHIDFSENISIEAKGIGQLANKWKVKELLLRHCMHDANDLSDLLDGLNGHKLDLIDVRDCEADLNPKKKRKAEELREVSEIVYFEL